MFITDASMQVWYLFRMDCRKHSKSHGIPEYYSANDIYHKLDSLCRLRDGSSKQLYLDTSQATTLFHYVLSACLEKYCPPSPEHRRAGIRIGDDLVDAHLQALQVTLPF